MVDAQRMIYEEVAKDCDISFKSVQEEIERILEFSKAHGEMSVEDMAEFVVRNVRQKQLLTQI